MSAYPASAGAGPYEPETPFGVDRLGFGQPPAASETEPGWGTRPLRSPFVTVDTDRNDALDLRTIVADCDPLARRLLRDVLQRADVTVIAEARTGHEAVELAHYYRPDVVVMSLALPGIDGVEATRRILARDGSMRVVVLTAFYDDEVGLRALKAGAVGCLSKDIDLAALPRALRAVRDGEPAISRTLAMALIDRDRALPDRAAGLRPVLSCLTAREWEVLDLLARGDSAAEMAADLVLSTETVRTHLKHVYRKLGAHSRDEALSAASRLRSGDGLAG